MANTLDPMDLKQILSLHLDGLSNRKIGLTLGISRNTVNSYMRLFKASDYGLKKLLGFDNASLQKLFPSHTTIDNTRYAALMAYFEKVNKALPFVFFSNISKYMVSVLKILFGHIEGSDI